MNIKIDPEFRNLIPAITLEEAEELEKSIQEEGCRDALIIWDDGTILDGHHRFEICQRHEIPFKTISKSFESKDKAKEWIIRNQLGRRNLSPMDRVNLAQLLKPLIEEKAKEKEITHTNQGYQKSGNPPVHTDKELAKIAGVSHDTIHKVEVIQKEATPEQVEQIQKKEKSINKVYREIRSKTNQEKKIKKNKPERIGEEFNKAWNDLLVAIKNEIALKWKTTDKAEAIKKIQVLLDIIKR